MPEQKRTGPSGSSVSGSSSDSGSGSGSSESESGSPSASEKKDQPSQSYSSGGYYTFAKPEKSSKREVSPDRESRGSSNRYSSSSKRTTNVDDNSSFITNPNLHVNDKQSSCFRTVTDARSRTAEGDASSSSSQATKKSRLSSASEQKSEKRETESQHSVKRESERRQSANRKTESRQSASRNSGSVSGSHSATEGGIVMRSSDSADTRKDTHRSNSSVSESVKQKRKSEVSVAETPRESAFDASVAGSSSSAASIDKSHRKTSIHSSRKASTADFLKKESDLNPSRSIVMGGTHHTTPPLSAESDESESDEKSKKKKKKDEGSKGNSPKDKTPPKDKPKDNKPAHKFKSLEDEEIELGGEPAKKDLSAAADGIEKMGTEYRDKLNKGDFQKKFREALEKCSRERIVPPCIELAIRNCHFL